MTKLTQEDKDCFMRTNIIPRYAHLKGYEDSMPIIRKLLGVEPDGKMPNNFIGRTMQRIIDKNSKEAMRESAFDSNQTDE